MLLIVTSSVPTLDTVTICGGAELPTMIPPKLREVDDRLSTDVPPEGAIYKLKAWLYVLEVASVTITVKLYKAATVGVPASTAVLAFSVNPAGSAVDVHT
jgi:hypothetical protein